jgi:hypothetical protein
MSKKKKRDEKKTEKQGALLEKRLLNSSGRVFLPERLKTPESRAMLGWNLCFAFSHFLLRFCGERDKRKRRRRNKLYTRWLISPWMLFLRLFRLLEKR